MTDFLHGLFNLAAHLPVLHDAFLQILDMDVLLHTDIFLHKIFQPYIHLKRDGAPEKPRKLLHIQPAQIGIIELAPESFIAGTAVKFLLGKCALQILTNFRSCQAAPVRPVVVFQKSPGMPEKQPPNLIGGSLHIKNNAHALLFLAPCLHKFQDNSGREIFVPQILGFVVLPDIYHSPKILNQRTVRIVRRCFVEKSAPIGVRIQHNLHGIDDRRLPTSGMSGKEIDFLVKRKDFPVYIMPVIQAYLRECFE